MYGIVGRLMSGHHSQAVDRQNTATGVLARFAWMLLGNAILAFSAVFIFEKKGGFFHAADVVFWITVAVLVLVRYLDIRFLNGRTAVGELASIRHWIKYAILLPVCAGVAWLLVHGANYLFVAGTAEV
jgi:hypothetical protein